MGEPPPREAAKQQDGSFILKHDDGSTSRWTRRPDGTWRKPERQKAGYVGELEQKKYVSPGSKIERDQQDRLAERNANKGEVPGAPPAAVAAADKTPAAKRNERKKEKRREKADAKDHDRLNGHGDDEEDDVAEEQVQKHPEVVQKHPEVASGAVAEDPAAALDKRIKAVEKKLRQVAELEERKAGGAELNPDQQNKIYNKQALLKELQTLRTGVIPVAKAAQAPAAPAPAPAAPAVAAVQAAEPKPQAQVAPPNRKALEKKLRQIGDLEQKQANGEALNEDEKRKIANRPELEAQLAKCGA